MKLKEISPDEKQFEANGKIYFIENRLSVERWKAYEKLSSEVAFEGGFTGTWQALNKAITLLNAQKWVDAAVVLSNQRDSIVSIDKRINPCLAMCALFLNTENEDRRYITDEQIAAKVKDWTEAGMSMDFFLRLAANIIPGIVLLYEEISQSISQRKKAESRKQG